MITAIVMASGLSRRLGQDKLKLKLGDKSLFEVTIERLAKSQVDEIIVVYRDKFICEVAKSYGLKVVKNNRAELGQSESIKLGIMASNENTNGYMFVVSDQPYMSVDTVNAILEIYKSDMSRIVLPISNGRRGNPVIFPKTLKQELLELEGDSGGKKVIEKNIDRVVMVEVLSEELRDIDTKEDLKILLGGD